MKERERVRGHLEQQLADALSAPLPPELEHVDMVTRVHRGILERTQVNHERRWLPQAWIAGLAAAACAGALILWNEADGFRARSSGVVSDAERWSGIRVHRASRPNEVEPVNAWIGAHDALLFSYVNDGQRPFEYLAIFGRGADGQQYFYHPSALAGSDAESIRITPGSETALRELISYDYAPGRLTIYGVFTHRALRVHELRALLRELPQRADALSVADARLQVVDLVVK